MSGDIILYKTSYVIVICSKLKSKKIDKKKYRDKLPTI